MTPEEIVRLKTSDKPVFIRDEDYQADGTQTYYKLRYQDIMATPPLIFYFDGVVPVGPTAVVDFANGSVTFTTAPPQGTSLAFEYYTTVFVDVEVDQFLLEAANDVNFAAALMLFAWAANASKLAKKVTLGQRGESGMDMDDTSVTADELRKAAGDYLMIYSKTSTTGINAPADSITEWSWTEANDQERFIQDYIRNLP